MPKIKSDHPAILEGRTLFPSKVKKVTDDVKLLKLARSNSKMGVNTSIIQKGHWKGFPAFLLTLEERATCPNTCHHWEDCYGSNMFLAHRFEAGHKLEAKLALELEELAQKYPNGFAVRLHVLGDFYSKDYVQFWDSMLQLYPMLHIWGYSAHESGAIYNKLVRVTERYPDRFWVRISSNNVHDGMEFAVREDYEGPKTFICPQEQGKVADCMSCCACWETHYNVKFLTH